MKTIFVGNRLTMEGKKLEIPVEIEFFKESIEDAIYDSFENVFTTVENHNFLKAMRINGLLFDFMEYHINKFFDICKDEASKCSTDTINKDSINKLGKEYFNKSIQDYKNRLLNVKF